MNTSDIVKVFEATADLDALEEVADFFGIGEEVRGQVEDDMVDLYNRGKRWADKCKIDWSELKAGVPWLTGNLSWSITPENEFETKKKPNFWVGVDLNKLLGPKQMPVTNYIDYEYILGTEVDVDEKDYTLARNKFNRTGPDHFIENVWWKYADSNLTEVMR